MLLLLLILGSMTYLNISLTRRSNLVSEYFKANMNGGDCVVVGLSGICE